MTRITNRCVLHLCWIRHYRRDEHGCVSGFQPIRFLFSAWTKYEPCLPWKWKLQSFHCQLPLKWINFHLRERNLQKCTSDSNPRTGHLTSGIFSSPMNHKGQDYSQGCLQPRGVEGSVWSDVIIICSMSACFACQPLDPCEQAHSWIQLAPREGIVYNYDISKVPLCFPSQC